MEDVLGIEWLIEHMAKVETVQAMTLISVWEQIERRREVQRMQEYIDKGAAEIYQKIKERGATW